MKRILFLLHITVACIGIAQSNVDYKLLNNLENHPSEKIHVHLNNDFLVSGEKLFYKVYCLNKNNQYTPFSNIAYVELINQENSSISKQKIALTNGTGYGDVFIDTKVKTGSYKLIAYTKWMLNKKEFFEKNIIIINPFSNKLPTSSSDASNTNIKESTSSSNENSFIKSIATSYKKREKIILPLSTEKLETINGDFSISVTLKDNYSVPTASLKNSKVTGSNQLFLPELRGSLIKGKISSTSAKLLNVKLALSFENNKSLPLTAITNSNGEFYFNIENLNKNAVYISILDKNKSAYTIELIESENTIKALSDFAPIQLDESAVTLIKNRSLYSQIENAYYTVKQDSIIDISKKDLLLDRIKVAYPLDDYTRFNTIKETFIEVIEGAGFYKKGDDYQIKVTDADASETLNYLPSLLIIDGRIIMDHTSFMSYNSRKIKTISLVKDKYFYGNAIYQGIVLVETFKGNYAENNNEYTKFDVQPVQPKKIYFFQDHKESNTRIPDFRTQLYWNPSVKNTTKEVTFYTSDVIGTYEITIQGYDINGKLVSITQDFAVE
ncbi:hypothetical protein EV195_10533 [Tenacibaculum skagerrakense]|uniref:MG2 domain-containing protein n=1 Tax=Tenacibaculum skagerrakense TaxID=186571 RepID=A0A4R2NS62_9FLAO|nr:hypothetical protein [Tenacibaculum skagerrakense]TCP24602.1 hypothetical protein EV195_10533 [Tenacibaculum skagerrakense]